MTDQEIRTGLREIDDRDDLDPSSWECEFIDSILYKHCWDKPLTEKQRAKALEIIERYENVEGDEGGQQSIIKLPPGMEKYFGRNKP